MTTDELRKELLARHAELTREADMIARAVDALRDPDAMVPREFKDQSVTVRLESPQAAPAIAGWRKLCVGDTLWAGYMWRMHGAECWRNELPHKIGSVIDASDSCIHEYRAPIYATVSGAARE